MRYLIVITADDTRIYSKLPSHRVLYFTNGCFLALKAYSVRALYSHLGAILMLSTGKPRGMAAKERVYQLERTTTFVIL
ncbi:hypothetical protein SERLA73DRAFT_176217 [Serpula lacrymans var. lacrymans S7.3]|uniref:Uncharacterized protein n=1 Tax=Serpula lacrymans var. lacrymans (strain S7.3) TaxID=936435 RepID=F8PMI8_SERL3|nr:hypothetical protein SERLA73DRAFT_176217 [Serpula lacrymans var. lacrymans S7.3]